MPGSIHASVLEAFDLPETIADGEDVAIKVALGMREYQTAPSKAVGRKTASWSLDFIFPVLNLRDNLLVTLLDEKGQAISNSEIDTSSIVEQGSFDVNLLLNGGGNVHLRLNFVLTEEERRRIDVMRAAALKRREQEALKLSASKQTVPVERETKIGSSEHSTPIRSLEEDSEKDGMAQDSSATASQEADVSQATHVEPLVPVGPKGKLDSSENDGDQIDRRNLDFVNASTIKDTDSEEQKFVDLDESNMLQSASEENEGSVGDSSDANLKRTSSSVKAKIKVFEKTQPQGATKQNHILSPSGKIQKFSPHNKMSPRKKAEGEAEQVPLVNEPLDDIETKRLKNELLEPTNQMEVVKSNEDVVMGNLCSSGTSEAGHTSKEGKQLFKIPMKKSDNSGLEQVNCKDHVEWNGRNFEKKRASRIAQKGSVSDKPVKGVDSIGIQDRNIRYQATEVEQRNHDETKSPSIQESKRMDLVGLSKQVLSGAVLIAAGALLWAATPKRRTSSLHQRSKQRKQR